MTERRFQIRVRAVSRIAVVCTLPLAAVASGSGGKTSDDPTNAEQTLVEDKVGTDSDEQDQVRLS